MSETPDAFTAYQRYISAQRDANALNKPQLFDALAAAGVTHVCASFDGEGDSGQIDNVAAYKGDELLSLPECMVAFRFADWSSDSASTVELTFPEAIETLCYGYLSEWHDGWENNDGAFGEFTLDVAARKVTLEFPCAVFRVHRFQPHILSEGNMAHPYHHSLSSVKKWGGRATDYQPVHDWFDESKKIIADFRHRALRHHAEGIFMAQTIFGHTITLSSGRIIPTRWVGEQHVREDLGFIPSFTDWVKAIRAEPWMGRAQKLEDTLQTSSQSAPDVTDGEPQAPNSPIDAAKAITPRWMRNIGDFDALEIHPCMVVGTDSLDNSIVEQCEPEDAHFWCVFGHLRAGGTDDFEDFATQAEAIAFHDRLIDAYSHLAGNPEAAS